MKNIQRIFLACMNIFFQVHIKKADNLPAFYSILNNIEIVSRSIGKENTERMIIPALLELTTDKQWRVRYGIAQFFPKFAKIFGKQLFLDKMEKKFDLIS